MPLANGIVPAVGLQGLRAKSEAPNKSSVACEGFCLAVGFRGLAALKVSAKPIICRIQECSPPPPVFRDLYIAAFRALSGPNPKISTLEPSSRTLL